MIGSWLIYDSNSGGFCPGVVRGAAVDDMLTSERDNSKVEEPAEMRRGGGGGEDNEARQQHRQEPHPSRNSSEAAAERSARVKT